MSPTVRPTPKPFRLHGDHSTEWAESVQDLGLKPGDRTLLRATLADWAVKEGLVTRAIIGDNAWTLSAGMLAVCVVRVEVAQ